QIARRSGGQEPRDRAAAPQDGASDEASCQAGAEGRGQESGQKNGGPTAAETKVNRAVRPVFSRQARLRTPLSGRRQRAWPLACDLLVSNAPRREGRTKSV